MFRPNPCNIPKQISFASSLMLNETWFAKALQNSYAPVFREIIMPAIDENPYAVLYTDPADCPSRPNYPVNIKVGALIIMVNKGLSIDDMVSALTFDAETRYALNMFEENYEPPCAKTLLRFFKALVVHMEAHKDDESDPYRGDLIHQTFDQINEAIMKSEYVDMNLSRFRLDSTLVNSYIKNITRLELLYNTVRYMMKYLSANGFEVPMTINNYLDVSDHNKVIYHCKNTSVSERMDKILQDALTVMNHSKNLGLDSEEFKLFVRVMSEQTYTDADGLYKPMPGRAEIESAKQQLNDIEAEKADHEPNGNADESNTETSMDSVTADQQETSFVYEHLRIVSELNGMNSNIVQNITDPDATYIEKYGPHKGYSVAFGEVSSFEETDTEDHLLPRLNLVLYYGFEQNNYSDERFYADFVEFIHENKKISGPVEVIADAQFTGSCERDNEAGITRINTNLTGRKPAKFFAGFQLSDDGRITGCPGGHIPLKSSIQSNKKCRATFEKNWCEKCPYFAECNPVTRLKKCNYVEIAPTRIQNAKYLEFRDTPEFTEISNYRNGVEALPSRLKNTYHVNRIQSRGLVPMRIQIGIRMCSSNVFKTCGYITQKKKRMSPATKTGG